MQFQGKTVVVIGLGKSGAAAARLLVRRGARVRIYDENPQAAAPSGAPDVEVVRGPLPADLSRGADAVVVSPGVPLARAAFDRARDAGVPLFGEIELAYRTMPAGAGPLLAVTGTNGKSTTTALLGELVRQAGRRAFVGGNLGLPFAAAYEDPTERPYDVHVLELSSFQLEGVVEARFDGAALLNLTPDHLDRYASLDAYGDAKARIFSGQPSTGFAVVNASDARVRALGRRAHVPVYGFSSDARVSDAGLAGVALPVPGGFVLRDRGVERVYAIASRALRGAHNVENAMAASLMAHLAGVSPEAIQRGLDAFPGLAHRLEFVRQLGGVEWINDSKATNVDSSLVALAALKSRVWLIAGGKGKGAPYAPLVEAARGKLLGVLTVGADAPALREAFRGTCEVIDCGTLAVAVERARALARAGDTVLLSPACASYDQFKHFEDRGDQFKAMVHALPEEDRAP